MDGTPLPGALSGNKVERLIEIDEALLYLVTGALDWLLDHEPLEQTGTLTAEDARDAISEMFYIYLEEETALIPVGGTMGWHIATPPPGWLICNGQAVIRADYPKLFDLWGTTFGAGDGTTTFNVLDMRDKSPMGAGTSVPLNDQQGQFARTILDANMPVHSHTLKANNAVAKTLAGGTGQFAIAAVSTGSTTDAQSGTAGNATPLPILHPVRGVHVIVRAK